LYPHDLGYTGPRTRLDAAGWRQIVARSISDLDLERAFEPIDAGRLVLVIDACNSGQALEAEERRRGPMNSSGLAQLAYEKGMYVLTAAQGYQAALEATQLGHGLLTYALIAEGLRQATADVAPRDGQILGREWFDFAVRRVPELQRALLEDRRRQGRDIVFSDEDSRLADPGQRTLQRPRAFYRREPETQRFPIGRVEAGK
jgi:hypothetical protein